MPTTYIRLYKHYYDHEAGHARPYAPDKAITKEEFTEAISSGANLILHVNEFVWTDWYWWRWDSASMSLWHMSGPVPSPSWDGHASRYDGGKDRPASSSIAMIALRDPLIPGFRPEQHILYVEVEASTHYSADWQASGDFVAGAGDGYTEVTILRQGALEPNVTSVKVYSKMVDDEGLFWTNRRVCTET